MYREADGAQVARLAQSSTADRPRSVTIPLAGRRRAAHAGGWNHLCHHRFQAHTCTVVNADACRGLVCGSPHKDSPAALHVAMTGNAVEVYHILV